jgi:hypothetical protein
VSDEKKTIDLGNIPPKSGELSDEEAAKISGGMFPRSVKKPTSSKPPTYIPAPPAPQVPTPYPSGM